MASPPHEKLTRREREIMDVLFALGDRGSAEEVRERPRPAQLFRGSGCS
jgi:hypothetical protein